MQIYTDVYHDETGAAGWTSWQKHSMVGTVPAYGSLVSVRLEPRKN